MKVSVRNNPTIASAYRTSFFIKPLTFIISILSNTSIATLKTPIVIPRYIGIKESNINIKDRQASKTIVDIFIFFIYLN